MFLTWNTKDVIVLAVLWLVALLPFAARAAELSPLPELSPGFQLDAYATQTDSVTKSFPEAGDVSFVISLPKTWLERMSLGQQYGELARFDGPAVGDVRPYFSLSRIAVPRENLAKMELISYVLKRGYVLRSLNEIDDRNVEALYVLINKNGDSFVVRARMRLMGASMVLAEYAVPVQGWDTLRDQQTFAMRSFKFVHDNDATIEQRVERKYYDSVRFYYPASWVFEGEDAQDDNAVTFRFATSFETLLDAGRLNLYVLSVRSLKDTEASKIYPVDVPAVLNAIRKSYEDKGYIVSAPIEKTAPVLSMPTDFSMQEVYNLSKKETDYKTDRRPPVVGELNIALFRTSGDSPKTYIAELYTPARDVSLYLWGVNNHALDLILKSIQ